MNSLEVLFQGNGETHPAVLAFIVLSGYCIHRNGLRTGHDGIAAYAVRRFFRIYPVFLMAAMFGFAMFSLGAHIAPEKIKAVSGTSSLVAFDMAKKLLVTGAFIPTDYFAVIQGNGPLQTVATEMWLYAVYPIALLFMRRFSERAWWGVIALCLIATATLLLLAPEHRPWSYNSSLVAFLPFWWIGAKFTDPGFSKRAIRIVYLPVAAWILLTYFLPLAHPYEQAFALLRQIAFALCFACLVFAVDSLGRDTRPTLLGRMGAAGYSVYAFHAPIVYVLVLTPAPWWVIACASISFGMVAHRLIEKPFMQVGKSLSSSVSSGARATTSP